MNEKAVKFWTLLAGVILVVLMFLINFSMRSWWVVDLDFFVALIGPIFLLVSVGCVAEYGNVGFPKMKPDGFDFTKKTAKNMGVFYLLFFVVWLVTLITAQTHCNQWVVAIISLSALPLFGLGKVVEGKQGYWYVDKKGSDVVLHYLEHYTSKEVRECVAVWQGATVIAIPFGGLFVRTWIMSGKEWKIRRVWFGRCDAMLIDHNGVEIPLIIDHANNNLWNSTFHDLAKLLAAGSVYAYMEAEEKEKIKIAGVLLLEGVEIDRSAERAFQEGALKTAHDKHARTIRCDFRTIVLLGQTPKTKKARAELKANAMRYLGGDEAMYAQYLAQAKWELGVQ